MDNKMVEKVAGEIWDHLGLKTKQVVPITNMRQVNGIAQAAIAALTPQWSDSTPAEAGWWWFDARGTIDIAWVHTKKAHPHIMYARFFNGPGYSILRVQDIGGQWAKATPPDSKGD